MANNPTLNSGPLNINPNQSQLIFNSQNPSLVIASQNANGIPLGNGYNLGYGFTYANPLDTGATQQEQILSNNYSNNPTIGASPVQPTSSPSLDKNYKTPPNINGYYISSEDFKSLEEKTNLLKYKGGKGLEYIKNHMSGVNGIDYNSNCYYLMLTLLVYGFDFKVLTANVAPGQTTSIIDLNFINDFKLLVNDQTAKEYIKLTPAFQMGCFDNVGCYGLTHGANASLQSSNPITGSPQIHSSLVTDALDSIHPGATAELVSFCNKIRTRAWLSLPKGSFGSLGRIVAKLQAVVEAFETLISDIYMGCIKIVQDLYAQINGLIATAQKKLLKMIDTIIPLDLLCLILDTLQVLMDDINFFTSLFQMSGPFLNYLNTFQNVLNITSQFVSNPFSTVQAYLPPQVNNIINTVNQIGSDPNGFLADKLNNYGYGYVLDALQGNLLGAVINAYGPQYASITPLGNALTKASAIYSRFGQQFPLTPATMGPNIYTGLDGTRTDVYGMPTNNILDVASKDFNNLSTSISNLGTIGEDLNDLASDAKNAGTAVLNFITGKKE